MDHHSTLPATNPAASTTPAPTLIRQGAGVGAAIGLAISWCVALGLGATWWATTPNALLFGAAGMAATIAVAAACGAVIGWSVPVVETRTDSTATH